MPTDMKHLKRVRLSAQQILVFERALRSHAINASALSAEARAKVRDLATLILNADAVIVTPGYTQEI
jgi:hypothetical protein